MKRKKGNKKGRQKGVPVAATNEASVNLVSLDGEDNSAADDDDDDDDNNNNHSHNNEEYESRMDIDRPSSTATDRPLTFAGINPDGSTDKTTGKSVRRVKVKLKTSKLLESQSDTNKSSPQLGLEKQGVVSDKIEDTGNSLSEIKTVVPGNVSKKPGSIKIKFSKVLGGLRVEKSGSTVMVQDESLQQKESKTPHQESQYNKQELDSAMLGIKKVMKMDAAETFNVPVNPEALGIPVSGNKALGIPVLKALKGRTLEHQVKDMYIQFSSTVLDVFWEFFKLNGNSWVLNIQLLDVSLRRHHKLDCLAKGQIRGADNKLAQELKQENYRIVAYLISVGYRWNLSVQPFLFLAVNIDP
ncbi:hypothetical protein GH714_022436 [Hevea brasiliensis]|uniref:Uncharacterized protein n=1 Tax=Hevea brasiliensis TaxID=3981 RepID=A0A6A6N1G8_HEVBR|nr:hypothetical protein GH714_022436 [Hevea brasiliensis]